MSEYFWDRSSDTEIATIAEIALFEARLWLQFIGKVAKSHLPISAFLGSWPTRLVDAFGCGRDYSFARASSARVFSIAFTLSSGRLPFTLRLKQKFPFLTLSVVPSPLAVV